MTPQRILEQYLEGAITFGEFIEWMARYHNEIVRGVREQ